MNMARYRALVAVYMAEGMSRAKAEQEARATLLGGAIVKAPRQVDARGMGDFSHLDTGAEPTPEQRQGAYQRMMEAELADPTGIYSDGGMEAGGIFGSGAVSFTDHDANARSRAVATRANMAQVDNARLLAAIEKQNRLLEKQQRMLLEERKARQLQAAQDLEDDEDDDEDDEDDDDDDDDY